MTPTPKNKDKRFVLVGGPYEGRASAKPKRKRNRQRRRRQPYSNSRSSMDSGIRNLAASIADPFTTSACIPDGSRGRGCFSVRQTGSIGPAALGLTATVAITPNISGSYYVDNGNTTAIPVITGNYLQFSQLTVMAGQYSKYRLVSMGLRATYIGTTNNDSGVFAAMQIAGGTSLATFNGATLGNFANGAMYFKTLPVRNGVTVTWRPGQMDDLSLYGNMVTTAVPVTSAFTQPYLVIAAYGLVSGVQSIQWEGVWNYEGQYDTQFFIPGGLNEVSAVMPAEPGWYEKSLNLIRGLEPIVPVLGNMALRYLGGVRTGAGSRMIDRGRSSGPVIEEL